MKKRKMKEKWWGREMRAPFWCELSSVDWSSYIFLVASNNTLYREECYVYVVIYSVTFTRAKVTMSYNRPVQANKKEEEEERVKTRKVVKNTDKSDLEFVHEWTFTLLLLFPRTVWLLNLFYWICSSHNIVLFHSIHLCRVNSE